LLRLLAAVPCSDSQKVQTNYRKAVFRKKMAPNNRKKIGFFLDFFSQITFLNNFFLLIRIENVLFSRIKIIKLGEKNFLKKIDFFDLKTSKAHNFAGEFFFRKFFVL
jgi:hypothetical protein